MRLRSVIFALSVCVGIGTLVLSPPIELPPGVDVSGPFAGEGAPRLAVPCAVIAPECDALLPTPPSLCWAIVPSCEGDVPRIERVALPYRVSVDG